MAGAFSSAFSSAFDVGTGAQTGTPGAATVTASASSPTIIGSGTTIVTAGAAAVVVTGVSPSANGSGSVTLTPGIASVAITGISPVASSGGVVVSVGFSLVSISATDPTAIASGSVALTPDVALVTISATEPTAIASGSTEITTGIALVTVSADAVIAFNTADIATNIMEFVAGIVTELSFRTRIQSVLDLTTGFTMSATYSPHVGDEGTKIIVQIVNENGTPVNVAAASVLLIKLRKSGEESQDYTAALNTDGIDGKIYIETAADTFYMEGNFQAQGKAQIGSKIWNSDLFSFYVLGNL